MFDCDGNDPDYEGSPEEIYRLTGKIECHCGADMELRYGRIGAFYGCTRYPKCRYIHRAEEVESWSR